MKTISIATVALAVLTSACSTTGESVPSLADTLHDVSGQNGRACVDKGDIQGYGVLDDNIISIDGRREYYLATVLPGCLDLVTSIGVAFKGGFGEVCGRTSDSVMTNDSHCTINRMYEFDNRDDAFAAYNQAKQQREALKAAAEEN